MKTFEKFPVTELIVFKVQEHFITKNQVIWWKRLLRCIFLFSDFDSNNAPKNNSGALWNTFIFFSPIQLKH